MIPSGLSTLVSSTSNTNSFAFPFKTFVSENVAVKVRLTADGSETELSIGTDYSLSGVGLLGGTVTLIDNGLPEPDQHWLDAGGDLEAGYEIFIYYVPQLEQLTRFRDLGRQAPVNIESGFDRVVMTIKGFFEGIGEVARSFKLPTNIHPDDFSVDFPSDLADLKDRVVAVNDTLDGFKMLDISGSEPPGTTQTLGAGASVAVVNTLKQHVRIKSDGGSKALSGTPFGTNPALFRDGMEIIVEAMDDTKTDFNTLAENDVDYGFLGNGGIELKYPYVVTFIYSEPSKRFKLKSNGAW